MFLYLLVISFIVNESSEKDDTENEKLTISYTKIIIFKFSNILAIVMAIIMASLEIYFTFQNIDTNAIINNKYLLFLEIFGILIIIIILNILNLLEIKNKKVIL